MIMLFTLVLIGATIWGINNTLRKHYLEKGMGVDEMVVGTMLGAGIFSFVAQLIVQGTPEISDGFWIPFIITAVLNIAIQYLNVKAQKIEENSITAPIQGLTPIFTLLTSWVILREFPTTFGLIGILSIVLGAYVLGIKGARAETPKVLRFLPQKMQSSMQSWGAPWWRLVHSKGAMLSLLTAFLGSVALNYDKLATLNSSPMVRVGAGSLVMATVVYTVSKISGQWKGVNKGFYIAIGIGLLVGLADVLMNAGFFYGIVPYVGSLKRFQIIVTAILAAIFLKEKYGKTRIWAAAIIFGGIVLIAF